MLTWFRSLFSPPPLGPLVGCQTCEQAAFWRAKAEAAEKELKAEIRRNRKREDELTNRILTAAGVWGVKPRDEMPAPKPENVADQPSLLAPAGYDEEKEQQITLKVLELEQIYARRGKSVPRDLIRKRVSENADYYLNSDEVELV